MIIFGRLVPCSPAGLLLTSSCLSCLRVDTCLCVGGYVRVGLSVCLSASISVEPHVQTFLYVLLMAVARSPSGGALGYVTYFRCCG